MERDGWRGREGWVEHYKVIFHRALFNGEVTSRDDSFATTSLDESTTPSVVCSSDHIPSSASAPLQPSDKLHPPQPTCPTPQGLLPIFPIVPRPQEEALPSDETRPLEQTCPFNELCSLEQTQASDQTTKEPYVPTQPPSLDDMLKEKGVEAWRTLDCASGIHVMTSSMVDHTSPPPRPRLPEDPHPREMHASLTISRASRRCWTRSAGKGSVFMSLVSCLSANSVGKHNTNRM